MEPLKGGAGQQIICEYLLAFGSVCLPSERLSESLNDGPISAARGQHRY